MKKIGANIFLIVYLFLTTEAYQVLKLPVILEHYKEHQKENKDIGFLEFLDIHYMHGSPVDDDYERDMQLPFKKANHHIHTTSAHVKELITTQVAISIPPDEMTFINRNEQDIQSRNPSSVFQPPKV